jgi:hypothetical protein
LDVHLIREVSAVSVPSRLAHAGLEESAENRRSNLGPFFIGSIGKKAYLFGIQFNRFDGAKYPPVEIGDFLKSPSFRWRFGIHLTEQPADQIERAFVLLTISQKLSE